MSSASRQTFYAICDIPVSVIEQVYAPTDKDMTAEKNVKLLKLWLESRGLHGAKIEDVDCGCYDVNLGNIAFTVNFDPVEITQMCRGKNVEMVKDRVKRPDAPVRFASLYMEFETLSKNLLNKHFQDDVILLTTDAVISEIQTVEYHKEGFGGLELIIGKIIYDTLRKLGYDDYELSLLVKFISKS